MSQIEEKNFSEYDLVEFSTKFHSPEYCLEYLSELKWKDGYECRKCKNKSHCAGDKPLHRQCTKCNYIESPTAHTLFHKVKFCLQKAFFIVYYVAITNKGMRSTELSRLLNLRQKTCWSFKRKVTKAMKLKKHHTDYLLIEIK